MQCNFKGITIDLKLLSKTLLQELSNISKSMTPSTKNTRALIFKINNSERKIKNSKDNKG